jgi:hypothetical protein
MFDMPLALAAIGIDKKRNKKTSFYSALNIKTPVS